MITRRAFTAGLTALPLIAKGLGNTDYDTVIVGAGVAGISSALALQSRGLKVLVLEARDRIGGRTHTASGPLGVPFDLGALWFHSAECNPLAKIAKKQGVELQPSNFDDVELKHRGAVDKLQVVEEIARGESHIRRKAFFNVLFRIDRPLSDFATDPASTLAVNADALQCASSPSALSLIDIVRLREGSNLIPSAGMGSFIASLGAGLPIRLNCRVERIDMSERVAVRLSGSFGTVTARTCIVTLSTALLAKESINFRPALAQPILQQFDDLPMGLMLKVGLGLSAPIAPATEFTIANTWDSAIVRIDPRQSFATVIASGDLAKRVSAGGDTAKSQFARDVLKEAFGSTVTSLVRGDISSGWDNDTYALGAYAHALPGRYAARKVYDSHIQERLLFAGEAGGREYAMTVAGAWMSGIRAAGRVVG